MHCISPSAGNQLLFILTDQAWFGARNEALQSEFDALEIHPIGLVIPRIDRCLLPTAGKTCSSTRETIFFPGM
jgi:hypothetical protein